MNQYSGTNFDDFLEEEGTLEKMSAIASKKRLALQMADGIDSPRIFSALQGVWQGIIVSEQDFEISKLTNPKFP